MINGDNAPPGGAAVAFVITVEKNVGYVLEEITPEDREKILKDVGESTAKWLIRRGGFDEEDMRLMKKNWAVDRDKNSYLIKAPTMGPTADVSYYFFFEGVVYSFYVDSQGWLAHFDKKPPEPSYERIRTELISAFPIFGEYGSDSDMLRGIFMPVFEGK